MARLSGKASLSRGTGSSARGFDRQEGGKRRPLMYIGIGGLILLIILLIILF